MVDEDVNGWFFFHGVPFFSDFLGISFFFFLMKSNSHDISFAFRVHLKFIGGRLKIAVMFEKRKICY